MEHKKQHWIPQSYLKEWCDPDVPHGQDEYVWIFSSDGSNPRRKGPKNIFCESDMYTIHLKDGTRVLDIEHGLSGLEGSFVDVRENVLSKRKELRLEDRLIILAFIAASFSRTPSQREHQKSQWGEALSLMEEMKKFAENATPEQREALASLGPISDGPKLSMSDVEKLAKQPLQEMLISSIITQTELFLPMNLSFLCTNDDIGFITSDNPCVWFDPDACKRPAMYRSPGLMYPKIEITLPVSPNQIAFLTWVPLKTYIDIPESSLDNLNRRTRFYADEYFVVRRNLKKEIWFDPGKPPNDIEEQSS